MTGVLGEESLTFCYVVDSSGFIISSRLLDLTTHELEPTEVSVTKFPFFYKPRWTGKTWIEGESQFEREERKSQQLLESLNPSERELLKVERELETIELLLEMGLI